MLTICILLWKHFLVRKRRVFNTILQLLSVVLLLLILMLINKVMLGRERKAAIVKIPQQASALVKVEPSEPATTTPLRVLYAPSTNATDALMDGAGVRLGLARLDHIPDDIEKGYANVVSDAEMWHFRRKMHRSDVIVTFQNVHDDLPKNLEYTIRMKMDFDPMYDLKDSPDESGRHRVDYTSAVLANVQWAVDASYLEMLTGAKINQTLNLVETTKVVTIDALAPFVMAIVAGACTMSHMVVFLSLITSLLSEKMTGIQELLKLVGVSVTTVIISHFLNAMPVGLVYALGGAGILKNGDPPLVVNTSFSNVAVALLLHYCTVVALGIFVASLINTTRRQATIVIVTYFGLFVLALTAVGLKLIKDSSKTKLGLIPPHGPLWLFMVKAGAEEMYGRPGFYVVVPFAVMACYIIIFLVLGIFFFRVFPGPYGRGLTWNAIVMKFKKTPPSVAIPLGGAPVFDPQYFEPLPDRPIGIEVIEVSMAFPKHVALTNVSLDVLQGEITVLLGHNGAGKTTLMNIITGMLEPTSGDVVVNGINARKNRSKMRNQLGMCPQHNLYYADLTVAEHYQIFAMLKGVSFRDSKKACDDLLKKLNLTDKSKNLVGTLSGGMKRRVQLACALAGGASVLVLDEPTSGLDVETRRELWDILLVLRGDRTVLLTTHFMEEADALGDRIAALHMGHIKCFATPMYLKKVIGSGYRLTLSTRDELNEPALTALVQGAIPGAAVIDRMYKSVTYNLPAKDSAQLPALFSALEGARASLGIETMGVGQSTLDDVFLKLCTDIDVDEFDTSKNTVQDAPREYKKLPCPIRNAWQFLKLLKRQALYMWSKKISFIFLQLLIPVAFMTTLMVNTASIPQEIKNRTSPTILSLPTMVFYHAEPASSLPVMRAGYKDVAFANVKEFTKDMFNNPEDFRVGIHFNDTHATAVYTETGPLAAPAAANVLSNTLAARLAGNPRAISTLVTNDPEQMNTFGVVGPKKTTHVQIVCVAIVFMALIVISDFVALPTAEREAGTRHVLLMAGCPLPLFWAATYTTQVCFCMLVVMLPILILAPALDKDATYTAGFLGAMFVLVLLTLMAASAFNNIISMCSSEGGATNVTVIIAVGFGLLGVLDRSLLEKYLSKRAIYNFVLASFVLMPPHVAVAGSLQVARTALATAWCQRNKHLCPDVFVKDELFNETACCYGEVESYYTMDSKGAGAEMLILFLQFVGYTAFLMILETQIMSKLLGSKASPAKSRFTDPAILAEKQYVEEQMKKGRKDITDAVLVSDIYKKYMSKGIPFVAVKGISFSVKRGECFGLLGVNGAGKSTTFKMLNAEENPARGNIFSGGYFFKQRYSYMSTYSYCGQFQNMDTFLTGRQNLDLVLTMRGFNRKDVREETLSWLNVLGMMKYADRRVSTYSGGCSRRLSAAAALCQRAGTTLLDEPTAGVDPVARRCVQAAVVRAKRAGDSIIIASHSMDEMEALCERMVIMSGGQIATLGSAPYLRSQYAQGYAAIFKLFAGPKGGVGASAGGPEALDAEMHRRFDCAVTDDRKVMIQYHINNLMPYSQLFSQMEEIKRMFPDLIEDYSVNETTLEEVFLSFAKEAIEHREKLKQIKRVRKREGFFKKWCGKK